MRGREADWSRLGVEGRGKSKFPSELLRVRGRTRLGASYQPWVRISSVILQVTAKLKKKGKLSNLSAES